MDSVDKHNDLGKWLIWPLLLMCSLLAGCGGGGGGSSGTSSISSTRTTAGNSSGGTNHAPMISNAPATSVNAGSGYNYTPAATDADGDVLTFSVTNAPTWATFSTSTGKLSGTPANVNAGTSSNIVISVSDGKTTTAVGPFSITVATTTTYNGTATLSWTAPSTRQDGSPFSLSELKGFNIYEGTTASNLISVTAITDPTTTIYTVSNLAPGTHFFTVTAYDTNGAASLHSNIVSKTIK